MFFSPSSFLFRLLWPLLPVRVRMCLVQLDESFSKSDTSAPAAQRSKTFLFADALRHFFSDARRCEPPPEGRLDCSVICTCRNEADTIAALLDGLLAQNVSFKELVICDGGSVDATVAVIRQWHRENEASWHLVLIESPDASISKGRNEAFAATSTEIVCGIDAGTVPDPAWLGRLCAPFTLEPEVEVVAGWYRYESQNELQAALQRFIVPGLESVVPKTVLPSARSFACRAEVWRRAGGFPEHLSFAAEDTLFMKTLRSVTTFWAFVPEACVAWSPGGPDASAGTLWRMLFRYARGDAEAEIAGAYYRHLLLSICALAADFLLALFFVLLSLLLEQVFFLIPAFVCAFGGLYTLVRSLGAYQPFYQLQGGVKARMHRLYALVIMMSAQCCGYLRGLRSKASCRRALLERSTAIRICHCREPLVYPSSLFDELSGALQAKVYLVIVYENPNGKKAEGFVLHPGVEQWSRSAFCLDRWREARKLDTFSAPGLSEEYIDLDTQRFIA